MQLRGVQLYSFQVLYLDNENHIMQRALVVMRRARVLTIAKSVCSEDNVSCCVVAHASSERARAMPEYIDGAQAALIFLRAWYPYDSLMLTLWSNPVVHDCRGVCVVQGL